MGYWAADISWCDGRFYIAATLRCNDDMPRKRVQMVTSSPYPQGPYDEPVFLDDDGIDPSIFHDEDGAQVYAFEQRRPYPGIKQGLPQHS